jgi:type IV pilus assembly protein PilV
MNLPSTPSRSHQAGASLIEVLVSVLVLAVGMLSMAALQSSTMRYGKLAEFKTNAAQLAEDLTDRMQSNPAGVRNGDYVVSTAWTATPNPVTVPPVAPCVADDSICIPLVATAVAKSDLAQWRNASIPLMPGAALFTQRVGGANSSVMDIWIGWQEPTAVGGKDAAAEATVNDGYGCPGGMKAPADVRCLHFRILI